jgi:hypothetical protein
MEICAQRSVGILPAHTLRAATPERPIATTPLATFTSSGSQALQSAVTYLPVSLGALQSVGLAEAALLPSPRIDDRLGDFAGRIALKRYTGVVKALNIELGRGD